MIGILYYVNQYLLRCFGSLRWFICSNIWFHYWQSQRWLPEDSELFISIKSFWPDLFFPMEVNGKILVDFSGSSIRLFVFGDYSVYVASVLSLPIFLYYFDCFLSIGYSLLVLCLLVVSEFIIVAEGPTWVTLTPLKMLCF